ncbi:hypothetical protein [Cupriavidus sp. YAF13]|uniref:hypothetical protein n=1 Tax=Cupriavidus sp. YAF13 TaxID=3233075 RepID=UPI003F937116
MAQDMAGTGEPSCAMALLKMRELPDGNPKYKALQKQGLNNQSTSEQCFPTGFTPTP